MFSPQEMARLHCFPIGKGFEFPPNSTYKQQWKLIGNSLNVLVVSKLLENLFLKQK
jgi:tRNA (cytosine38-C5)-methyltransferase